MQVIVYTTSTSEWDLSRSPPITMTFTSSRTRGMLCDAWLTSLRPNVRLDEIHAVPDLSESDRFRCYYNDKGGVQDEELKPFLCKPCPIRGRYVSIQITHNCTDCREPLKNVLQLAEVEVLGVP